MDSCLQSLVKLQKPFKYIGKSYYSFYAIYSNKCLWNSVTDCPFLALTFWFFSFLVTCVIVQKNGAGVHTSSSCFWDNSTDGSCTVRWENKTMYCIVSVFGLAI